MKRIFYLFVLPLILLVSCEKSPVSSFTIGDNDVVVGSRVEFINNSDNADRFEWDFGDGYSSNDSNPIHTFTATGTYEVTLTAKSPAGRSDISTLSVAVLIPSLLEIEVREYYSNDLVPNASIILYPTLTDWTNQTNEVVEGYTDKNGTAVFSDLDPYVYYVDVWESTHDNYQLASEDVGFIRTPEVLAHQIIRFIAYVDIVDHSKGTAKGQKEFVLKRLERKVTDKPQALQYTDTASWKELYSRRVIK